MKRSKRLRARMAAMLLSCSNQQTRPIEYAENRRTAAVALAAIEPDGAGLRWELTGPDASDFMIEDIADGSGNRDRVEPGLQDPAGLSKASRAALQPRID